MNVRNNPCSKSKIDLLLHGMDAGYVSRPMVLGASIVMPRLVVALFAERKEVGQLRAKAGRDFVDGFAAALCQDVFRVACECTRSLGLE